MLIQEEGAGFAARGLFVRYPERLAFQRWHLNSSGVTF